MDVGVAEREVLQEEKQLERVVRRRGRAVRLEMQGGEAAEPAARRLEHARVRLGLEADQDELLEVGRQVRQDRVQGRRRLAVRDEGVELADVEPRRRQLAHSARLQLKLRTLRPLVPSSPAAVATGNPSRDRQASQPRPTILRDRGDRRLGQPAEACDARQLRQAVEMLQQKSAGEVRGRQPEVLGLGPNGPRGMQRPEERHGAAGGVVVAVEVEVDDGLVHVARRKGWQVVCGCGRASRRPVSQRPRGALPGAEGSGRTLHALLTRHKRGMTSPKALASSWLSWASAMSCSAT